MAPRQAEVAGTELTQGPAGVGGRWPQEVFGPSGLALSDIGIEGLDGEMNGRHVPSLSSWVWKVPGSPWAGSRCRIQMALQGEEWPEMRTNLLRTEGNTSRPWPPPGKGLLPASLPPGFSSNPSCKGSRLFSLINPPTRASKPLASEGHSVPGALLPPGAHLASSPPSLCLHWFPCLALKTNCRRTSEKAIFLHQLGPLGSMRPPLQHPPGSHSPACPAPCSVLPGLPALGEVPAPSRPVNRGPS